MKSKAKVFYFSPPFSSLLLADQEVPISRGADIAVRHDRMTADNEEGQFLFSRLAGNFADHIHGVTAVYDAAVRGRRR